MAIISQYNDHRNILAPVQEEGLPFINFSPEPDWLYCLQFFSSVLTWFAWSSLPCPAFHVGVELSQRAQAPDIEQDGELPGAVGVLAGLKIVQVEEIVWPGGLQALVGRKPEAAILRQLRLNGL